MASKVKAAQLTVVIREEVKLNGRDYGNRNEIEVGGVNEISQRIMTVPTTDPSTTILKLSGSVGPGTYSMSDIKYARLTNLDNQNFVRLSFISSSAGGTDYNRYDVKLEAEQSYIFTNSKMSGSDNGDSFSSFADFTHLKGKADTAAVDIEIFMASK